MVTMTRRLRYQVAATLDGFIAGTNGEYDWIVGDPGIDFKALYAEFDAAVMGRKTYELVGSMEGDADALPGMEVVAFSRTLPRTTQRGVRVTDEDPVDVVRALKKKKGRDIWLFGGGALFRSLLDAGLVDTVEVAVMPVLLGAGIPLLPPGAPAKLKLADQKILPRSGIVVLAYMVEGGVGPPPRIRYVKARRAARKKRASSRRRR
jgi:dihydrofolate reductase